MNIVWIAIKQVSKTKERIDAMQTMDVFSIYVEIYDRAESESSQKYKYFVVFELIYNKAQFITLLLLARFIFFTFLLTYISVLPFSLV